MVQAYRAEETVTLGSNRKHCFACASILDVRAELCPKCGVRQPQMHAVAPVVVAPVPTTSRSKSTAGLLALFFGGIGVHKFYLGRGGMGVVYLLLCWTLVPAFIAFIEALMLFGMSDVEFARKFPD